MSEPIEDDGVGVPVPPILEGTVAFGDTVDDTVEDMDETDAVAIQ